MKIKQGTNTGVQQNSFVYVLFYFFAIKSDNEQTQSTFDHGLPIREMSDGSQRNCQKTNERIRRDENKNKANSKRKKRTERKMSKFERTRKKKTETKCNSTFYGLLFNCTVRYACDFQHYNYPNDRRTNNNHITFIWKTIHFTHISFALENKRF